MGFLFLTISPALRARLLGSLAMAADAVDHCGVTAYIGLAIVVIGGALIVLNSGPETQSDQDYIVVKRKSGSARVKGS